MELLLRQDKKLILSAFVSIYLFGTTNGQHNLVFVQVGAGVNQFKINFKH